jgi:hypothetical protein
VSAGPRVAGRVVPSGALLARTEAGPDVQLTIGPGKLTPCLVRHALVLGRLGKPKAGGMRWTRSSSAVRRIPPRFASQTSRRDTPVTPMTASRSQGTLPRLPAAILSPQDDATRQDGATRQGRRGRTPPEGSPGAAPGRPGRQRLLRLRPRPLTINPGTSPPPSCACCLRRLGSGRATSGRPPEGAFSPFSVPVAPRLGQTSAIPSSA